MESRPGKRKSAGQDIIFEVSDDDISSHDDDNSREPFAKVSKTDSSDEPKGNLKIGREISLVLDDLLEKNKEKEDKAQEEDLPPDQSVENISAENRLEEGEVNEDECLVQNESNISTSSSIVIQFRDTEIADLYKLRFLKFIQSFVELETISSDGTTIHVQRDDLFNSKDWVVLDETLCSNANTDIPMNIQESTKTPSSSKRKKKNKKHKELELFTLDTTPSQDPFNKQSTKYASKFEIGVIEKAAETNDRSASLSSCFNCDGDHSLKDCPHPRDYAKINAARQKMKAQKLTTRYHLDDDQKYSHLVPGKISDKLREALGLKKSSIPQHVYMMRAYGYPPGWLEEAKFVYSNLSMYGTEQETQTKKKQGLDPNKIVDYPGFNVPADKEIRDDYRNYHVPPFSEKFSKERMLEYFEKQFAKEQDDLTTCDMDLDKSNAEDMSEDEAELSKEEIKPLKEEETVGKPEAIPSPVLVDLEEKRETLLAALEENSSSSDNKLLENNKADQSATTIEDTSVIDISSSSEFESTTVDSEPNIKTSSFGTPILKSNSQYSELPHLDNFMKDVSPVINFENLPNSTGKYEQMTGLLQKVRSTLKNMQGCK